MQLLQLYDGSQKCPHCGTVFVEDMHPTAVEQRRKAAAIHKAREDRKKPHGKGHLYSPDR